jgi:hypothetical protein
MNPIAFLRTNDSTLRNAMSAIADKFHALDEKRDQRRADMIANEVVRRIK